MKTIKPINFSSIWTLFDKWFERNKPDWEIQKSKIQELFSRSAPEVDWKLLWIDFDKWWDTKTWEFSRNKIQDLILSQIQDLSKEIFIITYLNKGIPDFCPQKMTYHEAVKVKKEISGDSNGVGGDENIEQVTIINLKTLTRL